MKAVFIDTCVKEVKKEIKKNRDDSAFNKKQATVSNLVEKTDPYRNCQQYAHVLKHIPAEERSWSVKISRETIALTYVANIFS